ncbi:MAG: hypothetical protein JST42_15035 [Bacteroidetes bacterium]|nr:hypothetical protein [Bacteroidota bacterium]
MTKTLNYLISAVWLINGLFCKVLNLVPRHGKIVARIIGGPHAEVLTRLIGFSEPAAPPRVSGTLRHRPAFHRLRGSGRGRNRACGAGWRRRNC